MLVPHHKASGQLVFPSLTVRIGPSEKETLAAHSARPPSSVTDLTEPNRKECVSGVGRQGDGLPHGAKPMLKLKPLLVVGISALVAGAAVGFSGDLSSGVLRDAAASADVKTALVSVNRTQKSDRLTIGRQGPGDRHTISAVEVVGIRDAAIIYRDRDGRVLFKTDPLTNATLVTRGVVLPEVTVRETSRSTVQPVTTSVPATHKPAEPTVDSRDQRKPAGAAPQKSERPRIPEGCDPAASPIAAPQLSHILSKCLVEAPTTIKLASVL